MEEDYGTPFNQSAPEQEQIQEEESQQEHQDFPSSTFFATPTSPRSKPPASDSTSDARQELEQNEYQHQHVAPPASRVPMGPKPTPTYNAIALLSDRETDDPGPRCGHTLTAELAAPGLYSLVVPLQLRMGLRLPVVSSRLVGSWHKIGRSDQ